MSRSPKSRRPKKTRTRKSRPVSRRGRSRVHKTLVQVGAVSLLALVAWVLWEGLVVYLQFEGRHWDQPARVYASPLELYAGRRLSQQELVDALSALGYRQADGGDVTGPSWWRQGSAVRLRTRAFRFWDGEQPAITAQVDFDGNGIRRLRTADGGELPILRLDPLEIGSIFPSHGEDRLTLGPDDIPDELRRALVAVEDRKFYSHHGIDFSAILRALWVNLRAGEVRQGGSTLSQQLVKNYFLDSRRTLGRKIREAVMAVWLEALYDKEEIFTAYVNEVYLGQDGRRAIHGFGLGSRFYFGRPLAELELHEQAMLVALVRGPSYYNPWRHADRVRERRDLVLRRLVEENLVDAGIADRSMTRPLGVLAAGFRAGYHPAFLDLVRRQLAEDYDEDDLTSVGLRVFTTLDPAVQRATEEAVSNGVRQLSEGNAARVDMQGAAVVSQLQTGEVLAVVGGRDTGFDGFNRALEAARPIGSLVKPAVYLAAIERGDFTFASRVPDEPVEVPLPDGSVWKPGNFSGETHGQVTLARALAESLNLATVNLGLEIGVDRVAAVLQRLGAKDRVPSYPSILLGALEMTPFEVAGIYTTFASGGFRSSPRAVREVVDAAGQPVGRYPIQVQQAFAPGDVYQLNRALMLVMERGTGRSAASRLPTGMVTAGKTGTSDEFRDSWFAGFGGDNLTVVWLGNDDNTPVNLSGGRGALRIWADIMARLGGSDFPALPADGMVDAWVDYDTGELAARDCGDVVLIGLPGDARLPVKAGCGIDKRSLGDTVMDWLKRLTN
jgi:penicillin-binding protein 1B